MVGGNILIDFEDILVDHYGSELQYINSKYTKFAAFLKYEPLLDLKKRQYRDPIYEIIKEEVVKDPIKCLSLETLLSDFHENKENYEKNLKLTEFGEKIKNNNTLFLSPKVDKIIILYTYCTEKEKMVKMEIIKEIFSKYDSLGIDVTKDKESSIIKTLNWNLLITSKSNVIKEIIENADYKLDKKEFMVLNRKYSKLNYMEETLIEEKGGTINYF